MYGEQLEEIITQHMKNTRDISNVKSELFHALANFYASKSAEDNMKFGERVVYAKTCLAHAKDASDAMTKRIPPALKANVDTLLEICQAEQAAATNDNDEIYHELVPETVAEIKPAVLVNAMTVQEGPASADLVGPDIFNSLVPLSVLSAVSKYSAEKDELFRKVKREFTALTDDIKQRLKTMRLPRVLDSIDINNVDGVPKELQSAVHRALSLGKIEELKAGLKEVHAVREKLEPSIQKIRYMRQEEEGAHLALRKALGDKYSGGASVNRLVKETSSTLDAYKSAVDADTKLQQLISQREPAFKVVLALGTAEPSNRDAILPPWDEGIDMKAIVQRLRTLLHKCDQMLAHREQLQSELRNLVDTQDISDQLVWSAVGRRFAGGNTEDITIADEQKVDATQPQDDNSEQQLSVEEVQRRIMDTAMTKYDSIRQIIRTNCEAQPPLLQALTSANADFVNAMSNSKRGKGVSGLVESAKQYVKAWETLQSSEQFWIKLNHLVDEVVEGWGSVRKEREIEEIRSGLGSKPPSGGAAVPPPPPPRAPKPGSNASLADLDSVTGPYPAIMPTELYSSANSPGEEMQYPRPLCHQLSSNSQSEGHPVPITTIVRPQQPPMGMSYSQSPVPTPAQLTQAQYFQQLGAAVSVDPYQARTRQKEQESFVPPPNQMLPPQQYQQSQQSQQLYHTRSNTPYNQQIPQHPQPPHQNQTYEGSTWLPQTQTTEASSGTYIQAFANVPSFVTGDPQIKSANAPPLPDDDVQFLSLYGNLHRPPPTPTAGSHTKPESPTVSQSEAQSHSPTANPRFNHRPRMELSRHSQQAKQQQSDQVVQQPTYSQQQQTQALQAQGQPPSIFPELRPVNAQILQPEQVHPLQLKAEDSTVSLGSTSIQTQVPMLQQSNLPARTSPLPTNPFENWIAAAEALTTEEEIEVQTPSPHIPKISSAELDAVFGSGTVATSMTATTTMNVVRSSEPLSPPPVQQASTSQTVVCDMKTGSQSASSTPQMQQPVGNQSQTQFVSSELAPHSGQVSSHISGYTAPQPQLNQAQSQQPQDGQYFDASNHPLHLSEQSQHEVHAQPQAPMNIRVSLGSPLTSYQQQQLHPQQYHLNQQQQPHVAQYHQQQEQHRNPQQQHPQQQHQQQPTQRPQQPYSQPQSQAYASITHRYSPNSESSISKSHSNELASHYQRQSHVTYGPPARPASSKPGSAPPRPSQILPPTPVPQPVKYDQNIFAVAMAQNDVLQRAQQQNQQHILGSISQQYAIPIVNQVPPIAGQQTLPQPLQTLPQPLQTQQIPQRSIHISEQHTYAPIQQHQGQQSEYGQLAQQFSQPQPLSFMPAQSQELQDAQRSSGFSLI
ncbi:hypothetical protein SARC_07411 [Sphaeroforma arctica JP610]|uniref:BRO1 domain-containing protein n=1 Tax=Sphaeroforma arctica JP610 TaxID=667725 RepID=A0A0L0FU83_9EUKA|nr:hypothetical protein SARC_07411 [Sphaeroforma arctica JP610]KNC80224.1 hypothetical protein SARC_07411 [Sphaeroforma arctica JP610]|eukprot:XP_014154126.1 hypothetical protein SARC_07411 [Sphaeroforma arctica JP610]